MRWLLGIAVVVGCGGPKASPPVAAPAKLAPSGDANAQIAALADRACRCKRDVACARDVMQELIAYAEGHRDAAGDERARGDGERMAGCLLDAGMSADELADQMKRVSPDP
ncbi:MAG: hypothetical protein KF773_07265 [Deltaproteobacteria bacterium]|nr:hypothetical protein [Deltaproteobacteria bacterium]